MVLKLIESSQHLVWFKDSAINKENLWFWVSGNMLMRNVFDLNRRLEFIYLAITLQSIYSINNMSCCKPFFSKRDKDVLHLKERLRNGIFWHIFRYPTFLLQNEAIRDFLWSRVTSFGGHLIQFSMFCKRF